jgi:hypothetical protein
VTEVDGATVGFLPGVYPITITQGTLAAANYGFSFKNGTLTILSKGAAAASKFSPRGGDLFVRATGATFGGLFYPLAKGAAAVTIVDNAGNSPLRVALSGTER